VKDSKSIMEIRHWELSCSMQKDRHITKLIVAFRNFANTPKILAVVRYPVTGVLPDIYDVKQQSSEIDAVTFVWFGEYSNSSRFLLFHLVTARGYWKESSHSKGSFVAGPLVSYVLDCCDGAAYEHKIVFSTRNTATEIHKMTEIFHGNEAVYHMRVCEWYKWFRGGVSEPRRWSTG